jgi:hypothetical protein
LCVDVPGKRCQEAHTRRRGREAEGGGLLNRYTVISRIRGSNPLVSATSFFNFSIAAGFTRG